MTDKLRLELIDYYREQVTRLSAGLDVKPAKPPTGTSTE